MNYSFVGELLFNNEDILEEIGNSFINVKVIEFCDHRLLVFQILLVLVNQSVSLINY